MSDGLKGELKGGEGDRPFGDEEDSLELELTLDGEVLHNKMVFPVVRQALVECRVLFSGDIAGVMRPDGFRLVELFVGVVSTSLFLCLLVLELVVLVIDLIDLRLIFSIESLPSQPPSRRPVEWGTR